MTEKEGRQVIVIGAGPAGLTAAYELTKYGETPIVLEQMDIVGGLSRTESYKDYYFDMGGHRFFTKSKEASAMWHEILGDDFLLRPRLSRIYYRNKLFYYPLQIFNALLGLGVWQAILIVLSFIKWQIFPYQKEESFEQWVTNRFGKRLYEIFFKTYTEKVWGIPCKELRAEWAAQRIKDLSLKTALLNRLVKPKQTIKTLIEEFHYPRQGPGMLWNAVKEEVERRNGTVHLNSEVVRIHLQGNCITSVIVSDNGSGTQMIHGTDFISSMPVSEFIKKLDHAPSKVLKAAHKLTYRDFITVGLIVNRPNLFPDNWIYVHSPDVKVGRIQNFKNWSSDMVPDPSKTSLGLEYFCTEGDALWNTADAELVELAKQELEQIGLARYTEVEEGVVFRVPKAYPVYGSEYHHDLEIVQEFVNKLENFQTIGRNGLHRYNNQDHSMITGMLAARNIMLGEKNNLWSVNTDFEYHEEVRAVEGKAEADEIFKNTLTQVFSRIDPIAFGLAIGITAGMVLSLVTLVLVIRNGEIAGPHLQLLSHFFPGYFVSWSGSLIGWFYAFITGFAIGWGVAYLHNIAIYISALWIHKDIEADRLKRFLDYL